MEINMDPIQKQMLDDVFDAFTMLAEGAIISLMHVDGGFTRYTANAVDLLGLPGEYIPNGAMDWNDYLHPEDRKRYMEVMTPLIEGKSQTYDLTYRVRLSSGEYSNFRAVGAVLRGSDGAPSLIGGALINEGLTESVDPVTILPNKNAYLEDLARFIKLGKYTISLKVGVSQFSDIARLHGYTYGNRLLQEMSWLIREIVSERADVYRLNDASFAILSDTLSRAETAAIYDMIRYRLQKGIEINGVRNVLIANGGLISTGNTESNSQAIYSCLDYAYETSKQHTHGELVDFNGSINYDDSMQALAKISTIRNDALDGCKGFGLKYIPVIGAKTEHMNGAEAIIYWENEEYGEVAAEHFIQILERDFVFEEIWDFILKHSLEDGVRFLEKNPDFLLCINVYRFQLETDYFIENLKFYLKETGFPSHLLSLKLSADCRFIEVKRMKNLIDQLHNLNILVVLDGFGSGQDSILFLKKTPIDAVCLDHQLVEDIDKEDRDRSILEYLVKMASTCIEHINITNINTKELRDILKDFPVTTMQGEYFSIPLTADQLIEKYYKS